ncbi:MAG: hemerythrin domain-containing protein [Burkholderiaceae bacterium]|nr:hemerythrin domain-containing protein [Burkholderiaceae bacterium]
MSSIDPPADFVWSDAFLLGFPPMDATHREFVDCVNAMLTARDEDVAARMDEFADHAQRHFEEERDWMTSTEFPASQCHIDEHDAVLKSLREVRERLATTGDVAMARSLAQELARWFPGHADYMDASLSHWMSKLRYGGKPMVLRRNILEDRNA